MLSKKEAKQVRGLIQGETKQYESSENAGSSADPTANPTNLTAAQGADGYQSATATDGLIATSQDTALIKFVELRSNYQCTAGASTIRRVLVWWYKKPPSGAADLNPTWLNLTGSSVNTTYNSMFSFDTENAGSYKILSDKTIVLGLNGKQRYTAVEKVIVNKTMHFWEAPDVTTNMMAGRWSDSTAPGCISRGVLVLYQYIDGGTASGNCIYRVTYQA